LRKSQAYRKKQDQKRFEKEVALVLIRTEWTGKQEKMGGKSKSGDPKHIRGKKKAGAIQ